jgi:hypothetical protein
VFALGLLAYFRARRLAELQPEWGTSVSHPGGMPFPFLLLQRRTTMSRIQVCRLLGGSGVAARQASAAPKVPALLAPPVHCLAVVASVAMFVPLLQAA